MNDNAAIWWVIKGPVLASIMVSAINVCTSDRCEETPRDVIIRLNYCLIHLLQINFVLFIGIIIILVQKLQSPDIGGNESSIYL